MSGREQRMEHLVWANGMRKAMALTKDELRAGEITLEQAMEYPCMEGERISRLLLAVPGVGKRKTDRLLWRLQISPSARVREISAVRKGQIIAGLPRTQRRERERVR